MLAGLICAVVMAGSDVRYIVVPDRHEFVHGINLQRDEKLHLLPCEDILLGGGYPNLERIREMMR